MIVNGREIKFLRTMGANTEIADISPDGDMGKLAELMQKTTSESIKATAKFICALNRGYIDNHKYIDPGYNAAPLTPHEVLSLTEQDYMDLVDEALEAYTKEVPKIKTEPIPMNGKKTLNANPKKLS